MSKPEMVSIARIIKIPINSDCGFCHGLQSKDEEEDEPKYWCSYFNNKELKLTKSYDIVPCKACKDEIKRQIKLTKTS